MIKFVRQRNVHYPSWANWNGPASVRRCNFVVLSQFVVVHVIAFVRSFGFDIYLLPSTYNLSTSMYARCPLSLKSFIIGTSSLLRLLISWGNYEYIFWGLSLREVRAAFNTASLSLKYTNLAMIPRGFLSRRTFSLCTFWKCISSVTCNSSRMNLRRTSSVFSAAGGSNVSSEMF